MTSLVYLCKISMLCKVRDNSIQALHCVGKEGLFAFHFLLVPLIISCQDLECLVHLLVNLCRPGEESPLLCEVIISEWKLQLVQCNVVHLHSIGPSTPKITTHPKT